MSKQTVSIVVTAVVVVVLIGTCAEFLYLKRKNASKDDANSDGVVEG